MPTAVKCTDITGPAGSGNFGCETPLRNILFSAESKLQQQSYDDLSECIMACLRFIVQICDNESGKHCKQVIDLMTQPLN